MSKSEVDEISHETSRAARAAGRAVASFLTRTQSSHPKKQIASWSDLSRAERKEMKGEVSRALREERRREQAEAAQLRDQITSDIHTHHARVWQGYRPRGDEEMSDWFERQQELERQRYELEMEIAMADLSDTERGQAVTAVQRAHYLPMYRMNEKIFVPSSGTRSLWERVQAGLSRLRIGKPREGERQQVQGWENSQQVKARQRFGGDEREFGVQQQRRARQHLIMEQQGQREPGYREDYTAVDRGEFPARTPVSVDREYTPRQIFAVQDMRAAQLRCLSEEPSGTTDTPGQKAWADTMDRAAAVGLSREQIGWEIENFEANSRCRTILTYRVPGQPGAQQMTGMHADEAEAARWAGVTLGGYEWPGGSEFEIRATERGQQAPFFTARGDLWGVHAATQQWKQDLGEQERQRQRERETVPSENAPASASEQPPGRGASEDVHINGRTVVAENIGGTGNTARFTSHATTGSGAGGRRVPSGGAGVRATASAGATSTATAEGVHINGNSRVTAGNVGGVGNNVTVNPLMARTRDQQLRARIAGLENQVAGLTGERDRFQAERDEAVTKLVESTPPAQRYGSPQRRATQQADPASGGHAHKPVEEPDDEADDEYIPYYDDGIPYDGDALKRWQESERRATEKWEERHRQRRQEQEPTTENLGESSSVSPSEEIDEPAEELTEDEN